MLKGRPGSTINERFLGVGSIGVCDLGKAGDVSMAADFDPYYVWLGISARRATGEPLSPVEPEAVRVECRRDR